jgi:hypothetical protein
MEEFEMHMHDDMLVQARKSDSLGKFIVIGRRGDVMVEMCEDSSNDKNACVRQVTEALLAS